MDNGFVVQLTYLGDHLADAPTNQIYQRKIPRRMMYVDGVLFFLGLSLLLYFLLGGADFGAGILEMTLNREKGSRLVTRAIAPVWEANHIWLIIAVVILFNGFPAVYAELSTLLHIPIILVLTGIILRGTAFTFRHYDVADYGTPHLYTTVFRFASAFTVFAFGLVIAPVLSNALPSGLEVGFYAYFVAPWLNGFAFACGVFIMALSAYIAAVFLLGEVQTERGYQVLKQRSYLTLGAAVISGLLAFAADHFGPGHFTADFLGSAFSLTCGIAVTILAPVVLWLIGRRAVWWMRLVAGAQIALIMAAISLLRFPVVFRYADGSELNFYASAAPVISLSILFWALVIGMMLVLPALLFLFRVFKRSKLLS